MDGRNRGYKVVDIESATIKNTETLILEYIRWVNISLFDVNMQYFRRRLEQKRGYIASREKVKALGHIDRETILNYYLAGLSVDLPNLLNKTAIAHNIDTGTVQAIYDCYLFENKLAKYKK